MFETNNELKDAMTSQVRKSSVTISIVDKKVIPLNIKFNDNRNGFIGGFSAKRVEILLDQKDYSNDFLDEKIEVYMCFSESKIEVPIGTFYVDSDDVTYDEIQQTYHFVAYDAAVKFDIQVAQLVNGKTGKEIIDDIAAKVGVEYFYPTPNLIEGRALEYSEEHWILHDGAIGNVTKCPKEVFEHDYYRNFSMNTRFSENHNGWEIINSNDYKIIEDSAIGSNVIVINNNESNAFVGIGMEQLLSSKIFSGFRDVNVTFSFFVKDIAQFDENASIVIEAFEVREGHEIMGSRSKVQVLCSEINESEHVMMNRITLTKQIIDADFEGLSYRILANGVQNITLAMPMVHFGGSSVKWRVPWEEYVEKDKPCFYIETFGGNHSIKYRLPILKASTLETVYSSKFRVRNISQCPMYVSNNVPSMITKIGINEDNSDLRCGKGNGTSSLQVQFRTDRLDTTSSLRFYTDAPIVIEGNDINMPQLFDDYVFNQININEKEVISYRQMISEYAALNLATAHIDRYNRLKFKSVFSSTSVATISGHDYIELKLDKSVKPINSLVYEQGDVEDPIIHKNDVSIEKYGLVELKVDSNRYIELVERDSKIEIIRSIYTLLMTNSLEGFEYHPFESTQFIRPDLDACDLIEVADKVGTKKYISILENVNWEWNGGLKGSNQCNILPETLTDYTLSGEHQDYVNLGIKVNRNTLEISSVNRIVSDIDSKLQDNSTEIIQTSAFIQQEVIDRIKMGDEILKQMSAQLLLTKNEFNITFSDLLENIGVLDDSINDIKAYFKFSSNGLVIGKSTSPFQVRLSNEKLSFIENGKEVAYMTGNTLYITSATVLTSIQLGNHIFEKSIFRDGRTIVRKV